VTADIDWEKWPEHFKRRLAKAQGRLGVDGDKPLGYILLLITERVFQLEDDVDYIKGVKSLLSIQKASE
jgi:hypothetical protein